MFRLYPLYEMDGAEGGAVETGVDNVPAAEGQEIDTPVETEKQNNFEKAFAKRLAEKEAQWKAEKETELSRYKDYDTLKKTSDYFVKINGVDSVMSLAEKIELQQLEDAAETQNVPVEFLKRIQELEAKASKADELEKTQQEQKQQSTYWDNVNKFAEAKGIDGKELNQFMVDNQMMYDPASMDKSFEVAFKAMRADALEKQLEEAEKSGMKKLLQAKSSIPNVSGNKSQGQVTSAPPKTFAEARARAMARDFNQV